MGTGFVRFVAELTNEGRGGPGPVSTDGESESGQFARVALHGRPVGGERPEAEVWVAGNAAGGADEVGWGR